MQFALHGVLMRWNTIIYYESETASLTKEKLTHGKRSVKKKICRKIKICIDKETTKRKNMRIERHHGLHNDNLRARKFTSHAKGASEKAWCFNDNCSQVERLPVCDGRKGQAVYTGQGSPVAGSANGNEARSMRQFSPHGLQKAARFFTSANRKV